MTKKYVILLLFFGVAVLLALSSNYDQSTTNAAYKTTISGSDSARVAKWEIGEDEADGAGITMNAGMLTLEEEDSGTWYFEVSNKSDVTAIIENTSKIQINLQSAIFGTDKFTQDPTDEFTWNYLTGDNPIHFTLTAYKASCNELLTYSKGGSTISYDEYQALDDKTGYTETINNTYTKVVIFDTASNVSGLKHSSTIDGSVVTHSLHQDFSVPNSISTLSFGNTNNCVTFGLSWKINSNDESSGDITTKFTIYNEETGAVLQENVDFFEYVKYLSSIKGEPHYEFTSAQNRPILIKHSSLSDTQITEITSGSKGAWAKNTYAEYERYLNSYSSYLASLGYLESQLHLSVVFSLNVSQVD